MNSTYKLTLSIEAHAYVKADSDLAAAQQAVDIARLLEEQLKANDYRLDTKVVVERIKCEHSFS